MPVCTKCGFVIYREDIDPDEASECVAFAKSKEYGEVKDRPSYYRLGSLYEYLEKGDYDTAFAFLRASWQEESSVQCYREDLDRCLFHLQRYLSSDDPEKKVDVHDGRARGDKWHTAQLLVGEILRLRGDYEEAIHHFESLISTRGFLALAHGESVLFELELCKNRDSKPHSCDELQGRASPDMWRVLKGYGADLDAMDDAGQTALLHALRQKDVNSARMLIELGADINTPADPGQTALHYAIDECDEAIALLLIDKGADIHRPIRKHSLSSFIGSTPLHLAARRGYIQVASRLLDKGAEVNTSDVLGATPLHWAIEHEHEDMALLLIDKEADVHAVIGQGGSQGLTRMTPLHIAAKRGCIRVAAKLVEAGADVNAVDEYGATPAHFAIRYNKPRLLELLVNNGATLHLEDKQGDTLLRAAARRPKIDREVVKVLIDRGAIVTPTIRSLLDIGGTQLQLAVEANDVPEIVAITKREYFMEQLNLPCYRLPNSPSPLATAVSKRYTEVARLLIRHGANVHEIDSARQSLLFHAARANSIGIAQALIAGGANVNQVDMFEETPLHQAAWLGHREMVQLLLQSGANVNAVMRTKSQGTNSCFTPLHNAVLGRRPDVVRLLIAHGADMNAKDARGLMPRDLAAQNGDEMTFRILETAGAQGQQRLSR